MVMRIGRGLPLTLSALFLGTLPAAHADGILDQMENEVAAIVKANKGGVVSIEDEAAMPPRRNAENGGQRQMEAQQALVDRLIKLEVQQDGVTVQLTRMLYTYKPENPKVLVLKREKETTEGEVQKLKAELEKQPDAPRLQQFVTGVRLAQWTQTRDALNADLQKTVGVYKPEHPHVLELRQAVQVADQNILVLTKQQQGRRGPSPWDRMNAPKSGSGFSIGNGYVLTTADVVEGMQHPMVVADDGTRIRARLVGIDGRLNLGLLQLPAKANLPALKLGNSDSVATGNFAIVIGNQAGHANSVALTMVSGIRNEVTSTEKHLYPALLQVSGTIGAGTSGAPLLNSRGEVIGVIAGVPTGEWTETQVYSDPPLSFLPGSSGISGSQNPQPEPNPQDPSNRRRGRGGYGFGPGQQTPPGQTGGQPIANLWLKSPMASAGYAILINDLQFSINELMTHGKLVPTWLGFLPRPDFKMDSTDPDILRPVRTIKVRKVDPNSPASKAGLQPGDILVSVDSKPIVSNSELFRYLSHRHLGDKLTLTIQRNGTQQTVTLTVEAQPERNSSPPVPPNLPNNSGQRGQ